MGADTESEDDTKHLPPHPPHSLEPGPASAIADSSRGVFISASPNTSTSAVPLTEDNALEDAEIPRPLLENTTSFLAPAAGDSCDVLSPAIQCDMMATAPSGDKSGKTVKSAASIAASSTVDDPAFAAAQYHRAAAGIRFRFPCVGCHFGE